MTNVAFQRDVGAYLTNTVAALPVGVLAATTSLAEVNGPAIDRRANTSHPFLSCKVAIPWSATSLTTGDSFTVTANMQDAATTTSWADYDDKDGTTVQQVVSGVGTSVVTAYNGVLEFDVDLSSARRYIRLQVTPLFSATTTSADAGAYGGVITFGGANILPAA